MWCGDFVPNAPNGDFVAARWPLKQCMQGNTSCTHLWRTGHFCLPHSSTSMVVPLTNGCSRNALKDHKLLALQLPHTVFGDPSDVPAQHRAAQLAPPSPLHQHLPSGCCSTQHGGCCCLRTASMVPHMGWRAMHFATFARWPVGLFPPQPTRLSSA